MAVIKQNRLTLVSFLGSGYIPNVVEFIAQLHLGLDDSSLTGRRYLGEH